MDMIRPIAIVRSRDSAASRRVALGRTLTRLPSRRDVLRGLAGSGLGLVTIRLPDAIAAKKKRNRKDKKPKLQRNLYGCVDVGKACRGNNANCCSDLCEGKKPRRGQKDKSRCLAHNVLDCPPGWDGCLESGVTCGIDGGGGPVRGRLLFSPLPTWPRRGARRQPDR
jgi:hypothetical protein